MASNPPVSSRPLRPGEYLFAVDTAARARAATIAVATCPAETLERSSEDASPVVRGQVGLHPNAPRAVLDRLSHDEVSLVRWRVAQNPVTGTSTVLRLGYDRSGLVAGAARRHAAWAAASEEEHTEAYLAYGGR